MSSNTLSSYWWSYLLRGVIVLIFGVLALAVPGEMLAILIIFFGAYLMVDAVFSLVAGWGTRQQPHGWVPLLEGALSFLLGALAFFMPGVTLVALLVYVGIWAVAIAALRLVLWFKMRHVVKDTWGIVLSSIAYLVFGGILLAAPMAGGLALMWCVGAWAVVAGIAMIYFAFKMKP